MAEQKPAENGRQASGRATEKQTDPDAECRVAMTVFATVPGGTDAELVAQRALRQAFAAAANAPRVALPLDIPVNLPGGPDTVRIVSVKETGAAVRNGDLWVRPTLQAWLDVPAARRQSAKPEGSGRGALG